LDTYLGIHPLALKLEGQRSELLAANIANVDTPNYKARDIDFKSALATASANAGAQTPASTGSSAASTATVSLRPTNAAAPYGANAVAAPDNSEVVDPASLKYRVPMAPALDGNTVDEQLEQSAFAENSVRYQASLQFINSALRDLMTAITGS
jgi:flagellar basal-body rod protein FlgB